MNKLFEGISHATAYANFRPKTPSFLTEKIISYVKERQLPFGTMLDVGCGSGQSSLGFAPYFQKVIGIDTSANQIKIANDSNTAANVSYLVSDAEHLPSEDNSVDLIASGMAVHWFDIPKFLKECHRVLKPNGCIALYGHSLPYPCPKDCGSVLSKQYSDIGREAVENLFKKLQDQDCLSYLINGYKDIFEMIKSNHKVREDDMKEEVEMSLADYHGYLTSWSGYQIYINKKRQELMEKYGNDDALYDNDILDEFVHDVKRRFQLEGEKSKDIKLVVTRVYFLILSERPEVIAET